MAQSPTGRLIETECQCKNQQEPATDHSLHHLPRAQGFKNYVRPLSSRAGVGWGCDEECLSGIPGIPDMMITVDGSEIQRSPPGM